MSKYAIYQSANQNQLDKMQWLVSRRYKYIKKLLDEAEHDFMSYHAEVWVICWGGRLGFDNSWYHAKAKFNNSFVEKFLKQSAKVDFLWVCKSLRTVHEQGIWKTLNLTW